MRCKHILRWLCDDLFSIQFSGAMALWLARRTEVLMWEMWVQIRFTSGLNSIQSFSSHQFLSNIHFYCTIYIYIYIERERERERERDVKSKKYFSQQKYYTDNVFNIDNNTKYSFIEHQITLEWSCDTKHWRNDAENSAMHHINKLYFEIY